MSDLKPCPSCGGEAHTTETARSGDRWGVTCSCGLAIRFFKTEAEAIEAWNKRVDMSYENELAMLNELIMLGELGIGDITETEIKHGRYNR